MKLHVQKGVHRAMLGLGLLGFGLLIYRVAPLILWTYYERQALQALDRGFVWVKPGRTDLLPEVRAQPQLVQAMDYLTSADRWRPRHALAPRQMSMVASGLGDLDRAAS